MTTQQQERIGFRRALYLALTVLCIYYPITLAAIVPFRHWRNVGLLALPATVHFVFYVLLIIAIDRIIDAAEKRVGPSILDIRIGTIALSVAVAIMAMLLSQLLFKLNSRVWMMFIEMAAPRPGRTPPLLWSSMGRTNYALTFVIAMSIFYLILNSKSNFRMRSLVAESEKLKKESALAQLEALKNQVSPHFLFNSLSILSSLVHVDANLSEKFIDQLSKAYRYILEQKENETVLLKTELDFIDAYAFLLKIRFENKFEVNVRVTEQQAGQYRIAPLTLQLLIENSVKHNRMSEHEPLAVNIFIENDQLLVTNAVRSRNDATISVSTGIGLSNIKNRYQLLTKTPVQVENNDHLFTVIIPLL